MWMSDVYILLDLGNADHNTMGDLVAAIGLAGAEVLELDQGKAVVECAVPTREIPTIRAMEGVTYVRTVFTYSTPEVLT